MGSLSDHHKVCGGGGDWKGSHMRIGSNEPASSDSDGKGDGDVELRVRRDDDVQQQQQQQLIGGGGDGARRKIQLSRLGLGFGGGGGGGGEGSDGPVGVYKVYKRRWFGLVELTLLSLLVSWEVSLPAFALLPSFSLPTFGAPFACLTRPVTRPWPKRRLVGDGWRRLVLCRVLGLCRCRCRYRCRYVVCRANTPRNPVRKLLYAQTCSFPSINVTGVDEASAAFSPSHPPPTHTNTYHPPPVAQY